LGFSNHTAVCFEFRMNHSLWLDSNGPPAMPYRQSAGCSVTPDSIDTRSPLSVAIRPGVKRCHRELYWETRLSPCSLWSRSARTEDVPRVAGEGVAPSFPPNP